MWFLFMLAEDSEVCLPESVKKAEYLTRYIIMITVNKINANCAH